MRSFDKTSQPLMIWVFAVMSLGFLTFAFIWPEVLQENKEIGIGFVVSYLTLLILCCLHEWLYD